MNVKDCLIIFSILLSSSAVFAQQNKEKCEDIYREIKKAEDLELPTEDKRIELDSCMEENGASVYLKAALKYEDDLVTWQENVEQRYRESIENQKNFYMNNDGEVTVHLSLEDMMNHPQNGLGSGRPILAVYRKMKNRKVIEHSKLEPKQLCHFLGYDKNAKKSSGIMSPLYRQHEIRDIERVNDIGIYKLLKVSNKKLFGRFRENKDVEILNIDKDTFQLQAYEFRYYQSLKCSRKLKKGEQIQDFELDLEGIRRQVEREIDPPVLSRSVRNKLGLSRVDSEDVSTKGAKSDRGSYLTPISGKSKDDRRLDWNKYSSGLK